METKIEATDMKMEGFEEVKRDEKREYVYKRPAPRGNRGGAMGVRGERGGMQVHRGGGVSGPFALRGVNFRGMRGGVRGGVNVR